MYTEVFGPTGKSVSNRKRLLYPHAHDLAPLLESRERLHHIMWMLGVTDKSLFDPSSPTYDGFVKDYNDFALTLLHEAVGQIPEFSGLPENVSLALYRARRCFPPYDAGKDALDYLGSYTEPVPPGTYSTKEMVDILDEAFKGRGAIPQRVQFRSVFSNKGTMEFFQNEGGFNKSVGVLSQGSKFEIPKFDYREFGEKAGIDEYYIYSPMGQEFAEISRRDRGTFRRAFDSSVTIMRKLERKPMAFVSILNERSLKKRIPALAEGFCQVLSQAISDIGKTIQERLFPLTRSSKVTMIHKTGSIYLSGDYKDSTNYIVWEALVAGYYYLFRQAGLTQEQFDTYMEVVRFLCGEHLFYSSKEERSRYKSIFAQKNRVIKPKLGFDTYSYYEKNGPIAPVVTVPTSQNSGYGKFSILSDPPPFEEIIDGLCEFRLICPVLCSVRGLAMCYSLAAPALHLIGAVPHWKFRDIPFVLTGDDNASQHKDESSIMRLESEKTKTGMVPHDKQKSARGKKGFLIAERLFKVVKDGEPLREVDNFPMRILFPEVLTDWHALTMPEAVFRNLKEVSCKSTRDRIISYVYWKFESIYRALEGIGVTVGGPNGIFPCIEPTLGAINAPGGMKYSDVFKRPSAAGSSFKPTVAIAMLCPPMSIPYEDDIFGVKKGTDRFPTLDAACDALRAYSPVSPYFNPIPSVDRHQPSFISTVRDNIDTYIHVPRQFNSAWPPIGDPDIEEKDLDDSYPPWAVDSFEKNEAVKVICSLDNEDGKGVQIPHRLVADHPLDDSMVVCEESGYRLPLGYFTSSFRCDYPVGTSLRHLSNYRNHWFIDLANTFPLQFRAADGVFAIDHYLRVIGPLIREPTVIYLITEIPGQVCCKAYDWDGVLVEAKPKAGREIISNICAVRAHPRVVAHAGADNEYRALSNIIRGFSKKARMYYTSWDKHWLAQSRIVGASRAPRNWRH